VQPPQGVGFALRICCQPDLCHATAADKFLQIVLPKWTRRIICGRIGVFRCTEHSEYVSRTVQCRHWFVQKVCIVICWKKGSKLQKTVHLISQTTFVWPPDFCKFPPVGAYLTCASEQRKQSKTLNFMQILLAQSSFGRILLHLACAYRDHKYQWHWRGIQRELFRRASL